VGAAGNAVSLRAVRQAFIEPTTPKPDCDYGRQHRVKAGKRALTRHYRPCFWLRIGVVGEVWVGAQVLLQRAGHPQVAAATLPKSPPQGSPHPSRGAAPGQSIGTP